MRGRWRGELDTDHVAVVRHQGPRANGIPVVVLEDAADAVPLARALVAGGLPDAVMGAGTVTSAGQAVAARVAGARFLVSPGMTPALLDALQAGGVPFLAGTSSPSDVVALLERGLTAAKLYPAEALRGLALLRALAGPFPTMRFCPTGGIDGRRAAAYLTLPNVACVVPAAAVEAGDWRRVEELACAASALGDVAGVR